MGRGRSRGGQGSLARVVPEFGRAGRSVGYGWSAVDTRRTMRAGRDVREEVGTPSFTPASLVDCLALPIISAHRTTSHLRREQRTPLENLCNLSSSPS